MFRIWTIVPRYYGSADVIQNDRRDITKSRCTPSVNMPPVRSRYGCIIWIQNFTYVLHSSITERDACYDQHILHHAEHPQMARGKLLLKASVRYVKQWFVVRCIIAEVLVWTPVKIMRNTWAEPWPWLEILIVLCDDRHHYIKTSWQRNVYKFQYFQTVTGRYPSTALHE